MAESGVLKFHVDGKPFEYDDLTYREKREARRIVRELADDPTLRWFQADPEDQGPAMIFVVRQRTDPAFTLDMALDSKDEDYWKPVPEKRPTKRATTKV
jgi:hypothetical protein